jgi:hypothetical protein
MTFAEALPLFAQAGGGFGGGGGAAATDTTTSLIIIAVELVILVVAIVVAVMFYLTLSRALQQCSPRNRLMEPGMVWLNFIPCFNFVWIFFTVIRVSDSLRNEFEDRGMRVDGDCGKGIGITYAVLKAVSIIPLVNYVSSWAALVFLIIYWVKIAGLSKQLQEGGGYRNEDEDDRPSRRRRDEREDEEDDRPSRRRREEPEDDPEDRPSRRRREEPEDDLDDDRPRRRRREDD